jgi:hypothetical protein
MEIKKINRKRIEEKKEQEERIANAKRRMARQERADNLRVDKIPKKRKAAYIGILTVLVIVSLGYNFWTLSRANQPIQIEATDNVDSLTLEFYELCDDIETIKIDQGS